MSAQLLLRTSTLVASPSGVTLTFGQSLPSAFHLAAPHVLPLDLDRLLDLHDHLGAAPHLFHVVHGGAHRLVLVVGKAAAQAAAALHHHLVAGLHQGLGTRRHQGDAVLVGLYLFGDADKH